MEFIKKMKKREFIEMGLKALAALIAAFLAIILMEGMIYGIKLKGLKNNTGSTFASSDSTIAYCIEQEKDNYLVLLLNENSDKEWSSKICKESELKDLSVKEIKHKAPNAFVFSISPVHYVVMFVFVGAIAGFFVYKFIKLSKEYTKIEDEFNRTGTISF